MDDLLRQLLESRGYDLNDYHLFKRTITRDDITLGDIVNYKVGGDIVILHQVNVTGSIADLHTNFSSGYDFLKIESLKDDWIIKNELILERAQETLTSTVFFGRAKNFKILTGKFDITFPGLNLFDSIYNISLYTTILQKKIKK